jgi:hypothetical protein
MEKKEEQENKELSKEEGQKVKFKEIEKDREWWE